MKKLLSLALVLVMVLSMAPAFALQPLLPATTISIADFAPRKANELEGIAPEYQQPLGFVLQPTEVWFDHGKTALMVLEDVCKTNNLTLELHTQYNYVSKINGFGEMDAGEASGWMFKINGYMSQTAISETILEAGDVVEILYSCDYGVDLGADFANNSKLLAGLELVDCQITTEFNPETTEYDLALLANKIQITATQENTNSKVRYFLNDREFKYKQEIWVEQDDVITIRCYNSAFGTQDYTEYTFTVVEAAENTDPQPSPPMRLPEFTDVLDSHWAYDYIARLADNGVIQGITEARFAPEDNVTRAQFATFLYRLQGAVILADPDSKFSDVNPDDWFADAILWAAANGIVTGHSDGTFRPNASITRQDMAVLAYRYISSVSSFLVLPDPLPAFPDDNRIADYAKEAVGYLYSQKFISGRNDGSFDPTATLTRAEAAKIIYFCMARG